jgi:hypothetical protein
MKTFRVTKQRGSLQDMEITPVLPTAEQKLPPYFDEHMNIFCSISKFVYIYSTISGRNLVAKY